MLRREPARLQTDVLVLADVLGQRSELGRSLCVPREFIELGRGGRPRFGVAGLIDSRRKTRTHQCPRLIDASENRNAPCTIGKLSVISEPMLKNTALTTATMSIGRNTSDSHAVLSRAMSVRKRRVPTRTRLQKSPLDSDGASANL